MAANVETMGYVGDVPWHGEGVNVASVLQPGEKLTPERFREISGLTWEVERAPMYMKVGGKYIPVPKEALYRDSDEKFFDVISDKWHEVRNEEAFNFFEEFCDAGHMHLHTAGSLMGGRMVWVMAKIDEEFSLFKGKDRVENNILFSLPHQYGKKITVMATPIRVVCANTLQLALRGGTADMMVSLNHRKAFDAESVKETLGIATTKLGEYKEMAQFLASKKFKKEQVKEYVAHLFPTTAVKTGKAEADESLTLSRPAMQVLDAIETQPGAELGEGTWWAPFNAVTFSIDHTLGHSVDTRLTSSWYGANRKKKLEALELAVEYANNAA